MTSLEVAWNFGAQIIEKHFTLSKKLYGSDAKHSMEQKEFKFYVDTIKNIKKKNKSFVNKDKLTPFKKMKKMKCFHFVLKQL